MCLFLINASCLLTFPGKPSSFFCISLPRYSWLLRCLFCRPSTCFFSFFGISLPRCSWLLLCLFCRPPFHSVSSFLCLFFSHPFLIACALCFASPSSIVSAYSLFLIIGLSFIVLVYFLGPFRSFVSSCSMALQASSYGFCLVVSGLSRALFRSSSLWPRHCLLVCPHYKRQNKLT